MRYITPKYTKEEIETKDIVLTSSSISLLGGATLTEVNTDTAQVSTSVNAILGRR